MWKSLFLLFCAVTFGAKPPLVVYTEDSFVTVDGLGPILKQKFEKKTGESIHFIAFPSAQEALNQVAIEGQTTKADLVMGVDNVLADRARDPELFRPFDENLWKGLSGKFSAPDDHYVLPFEFGDLAFVYDSSRAKVPENLSLKDLSEQTAFHKKIVIEDPRTSSVGLSFLVWTHLLFSGPAFDRFWKQLSDHLLTIAPGWTGAYGLFVKKETELVLSYTTSPAYHREKEKNSAIKAVIFPEGNFRQVLGLALTKTARSSASANAFAEFLVSEDAQKEIPLHDWLYPVREVPLPLSFTDLPKLRRVLFPSASTARAKKEWLRQWTRLLSTGR